MIQYSADMTQDELRTFMNERFVLADEVLKNGTPEEIAAAELHLEVVRDHFMKNGIPEDMMECLLDCDGVITLSPVAKPEAPRTIQ